MYKAKLRNEPADGEGKENILTSYDYISSSSGSESYFTFPEMFLDQPYTLRRCFTYFLMLLHLAAELFLPLT